MNKEEPTIVFLIETKSNREWMEKVKEKCNLKHSLIIPSNGVVDWLYYGKKM